MARFLDVTLGVVIAALVGVVGYNGYKMYTQPKPRPVIQVTWEGQIDLDFYHKVTSDLALAKATGSNLKVDLISPGGSALLGFDVARKVRDASNAGTKIEIHAHGLCASACTPLLAAGTPGYRFIGKQTLYLVHPIQVGGGWGPMQCKDKQADAKDIDDRAINTLIDVLTEEYVEFSGQPKSVVDEWLKCGKEQVGEGQLAIDLKLADKVE